MLFSFDHLSGVKANSQSPRPPGWIDTNSQKKLFVELLIKFASVSAVGSQKKSPNKSRAGKLNLKFSQMKANFINIHLNYISSEGELQMILNYLDSWKVDQNSISNGKVVRHSSRLE